ncbi:MAG: hypothetical protein OEW69_04450 [Nitrospirota bacterium]|nr:hypothetical protein [Nitrospirota bacterium]
MRKGLVLGAIILAGILLFGTQAMAYDSILFPYFSSGGGDMTFVQILNVASVGTPGVGTTQGKLNYVYVYNSGNEICTHYDDSGKITKNDILLYEVTGQIAGQLLPGDTTSTSPKLTVSPAWGFLVVEQNSSNFASGQEGSLMGQAIIVNANTGTGIIYNAINDPDEYDGDNYFLYNAGYEHYLTFLPTTYASTVFYLFPVFIVDLTEDVFYSLVEIGHNPWSENNEGVYDNNESLKSGIKTIPVGCYCPGEIVALENLNQDLAAGCGHFAFPIESANFQFTLAELMSGAQYNAVKGTGGWMGIYWQLWGYAYKIVSSSLFGMSKSSMVYEPQDGSHYSYTK